MEGGTERVLVLKHPSYQGEVYYGRLHVADNVFTFTEDKTEMRIKVTVDPSEVRHVDDYLMRIYELFRESKSPCVESLQQKSCDIPVESGETSEAQLPKVGHMRFLTYNKRNKKKRYEYRGRTVDVTPRKERPGVAHNASAFRKRCYSETSPERATRKIKQ